MCCLSMPCNALDLLIDAVCFSNKICQVVGDAGRCPIVDHEVHGVGLRSRSLCSWHGVQSYWFIHLVGSFAFPLRGAHNHVIHH